MLPAEDRGRQLRCLSSITYDDPQRGAYLAAHIKDLHIPPEYSQRWFEMDREFSAVDFRRLERLCVCDFLPLNQRDINLPIVNKLFRNHIRILTLKEINVRSSALKKIASMCPQLQVLSVVPPEGSEFAVSEHSLIQFISRLPELSSLRIHRLHPGLTNTRVIEAMFRNQALIQLDVDFDWFAISNFHFDGTTLNNLLGRLSFLHLRLSTADPFLSFRDALLNIPILEIEFTGPHNQMSLLPGLSRLRNLNRLSLCFTDGPTISGVELRALTHNWRNLRTLNIFHPYLTPQAAACQLNMTRQDLELVFNNLPNLEVFNIWGNFNQLHLGAQRHPINEETLYSLGRSCPRLTECNVSFSCWIDFVQFTQFMVSRGAVFPALRILRVECGNLTGVVLTPLSANTASEFCRLLPSLRSFEMRNPTGVDVQFCAGVEAILRTR